MPPTAPNSFFVIKSEELYGILGVYENVQALESSFSYSSYTNIEIVMIYLKDQNKLYSLHLPVYLDSISCSFSGISFPFPFVSELNYFSSHMHKSINL